MEIVDKSLSLVIDNYGSINMSRRKKLLLPAEHVVPNIPQLDDRSRGLRRYRRNIRQKALFSPLGPKVGPFFDILYSTVDDKEFLISLRDRLLCTEYSSWFNYLKEVSATCKQFGTEVSKDWKFFVNIELALGYFETQTNEDLLSRVRAWVGPRPSLPKDESQFCDLFRAEARKLFSTLVIQGGSIKSFCENRNLWATAGGSQDVGLTYESGNVYQKSKWSYAFSLTDDDIYRELFKVDRGRAVVSSVEGAGKDRIIISSDNSLHIKMSYINTLIERPLSLLFKKSKLSSLFYGVEDTLNMYIESMEQCGDKSLLKVPIDQSSFDQNQPKEHILIILNELQAKISDPIDAHIMSLIINSIINTEVRVGRHVLPYEYGLLSGWRWTALLGTLCNIISLKAICTSMQVDAAYTCQGDDVSLIVKNSQDLVRVLGEYQRLGYEVNPNKFWISTYRNEFLRRVFTHDKVDGYPCRSILSILWKKPQGSFVPKSLREELESVLQNWSAFLGRSGIIDLKKGLKLGMWEDLVGAVSGRLTKDQINDWLLTARSLGGGGLAVSGHTVLSTERQVRDDRFTGYRADTILDTQTQHKYVHSRLWGRRAKYTSELIVRQSDVGVVNNLSLFTFFKNVESVPVDALVWARPVKLSIHVRDDAALSDEGLFLLEETIRSRFTLSTYDKVIRGYYGGTGTAVLDHLRKAGSVRILKDFLLGSLRMNTPTIIGANPILVSHIKNSVESQFYQYLCTRSSVNYGWVKAGLILAEESIRFLYGRACQVVGTFVA